MLQAAELLTKGGVAGVSVRRNRLLGIPKLEDANDAGGALARDCTLILTEVCLPLSMRVLSHALCRVYLCLGVSVHRNRLLLGVYVCCKQYLSDVLFFIFFGSQGDSAKALAVSGLSELGRDRFGVFPLKGKLLNVRDAQHKQLVENVELNHLK